MAEHGKIGIGIDTGGTYTDAVAFDFTRSLILASGKALTTREDLSIGIAGALDTLPKEYIRAAAIVSLSTTLATNACLEDKGGRARMLIFGINDELGNYNAESKYGLKSEAVRLVKTYGSADGLRVDEPDWDEVLRLHEAWLTDSDAITSSEVYAVFNGGQCEKRFKNIISEKTGLPITCSNELSSELNILIRSSTALLNARMSPVIEEFIKSAEAVFRGRGCLAPIMVVRSDGTLMSSQLAASRPVETIQSGPAASVLAGKQFCGDDNYIIVDMGGTSTDIAIVENGKPVMADIGIRLGGWQTSVRGAKIKPFALGGDSAVRLNEGMLTLSHRRVTPLCVASARFPEIKTELISLLTKNHYNKFPLHEFFWLVREPESGKSFSHDENSLIEALRSGPVMLETLKDITGIDLYHFDGERLESEGIIMRAGLTPTDFMHIRGDFPKYDTESSVLAARYLLRSLGRDDSPEGIAGLSSEVYELVEGKLYEMLLSMLLEQRFKDTYKNGIDTGTQRLIREAWLKRRDPADALLRHSFGTSYKLVGVGAPIHVFLPEVAYALGAECVLPEHAGVANAIGALSADINAVSRVEISQRVSLVGENFYIVHAPAGSERVTSLDKAIEAAKSAASAAALSEAKLRGAPGNPEVKTSVVSQKTKSAWGQGVEIGRAVVAEVEIDLLND